MPMSFTARYIYGQGLGRPRDGNLENATHAGADDVREAGRGDPALRV